MSLADILSRKAGDCRLLNEDINSIINGMKNKKPASRKSIEKMTVLRKDTQALIEAENTKPEIQFIKDKLKEIIG